MKTAYVSIVILFGLLSTAFGSDQDLNVPLTKTNLHFDACLIHEPSKTEDTLRTETETILEEEKNDNESIYENKEVVSINRFRIHPSSGNSYLIHAWIVDLSKVNLENDDNHYTWSSFEADIKMQSNKHDNTVTAPVKEEGDNHSHHHQAPNHNENHHHSHNPEKPHGHDKHHGHHTQQVQHVHHPQQVHQVHQVHNVQQTHHHAHAHSTDKLSNLKIEMCGAAFSGLLMNQTFNKMSAFTSEHQKNGSCVAGFLQLEHNLYRAFLVCGQKKKKHSLFGKSSKKAKTGESKSVFSKVGGMIKGWFPKKNKSHDAVDHSDDTNKH